MKNKTPFELTVDKATKMVTINMDFAAGISTVWDAFTKAEILDQWYAPKPFVAKTKFMDFKVGGRRFFAMVSPEGQERWSLQKFTSISPKANFKYRSAFADKDENPELAGSDWDLNFSEHDGTTTVNISIYNESLARLESILEGFKTGMALTFENLTNMLSTLSKK